MRLMSRNVETAIVQCHLEWMALFPDSLIARKRGLAEAEQARDMAERLIFGPAWYATPDGQRSFEEFDAWLRAEGHARNPGTTADLVTASLFVALREGIIRLPLASPFAAAFGRRVKP
jgi:triphosphoribosyl-dephospho-CoA synthase